MIAGIHAKQVRPCFQLIGYVAAKQPQRGDARYQKHETLESLNTAMRKIIAHLVGREFSWSPIIIPKAFDRRPICASGISVRLGRGLRAARQSKPERNSDSSLLLRSVPDSSRCSLGTTPPVEFEWRRHRATCGLKKAPTVIEYGLANLGGQHMLERWRHWLGCVPAATHVACALIYCWARLFLWRRKLPRVPLLRRWRGGRPRYWRATRRR